MSHQEEKKNELVEQVDVDRIDIENVERNQLFEQVYGKDIADKAQFTLNELKSEQNRKAPSEQSSTSSVRRVFSSEESRKDFLNSGLDVDTNARLSVFNKEKIYDGDWTESTLNLLESMMKKCGDSANAYAAAARAARSKHRIASIPLIFIGTVATAVSFFTAGDVCDSDDDNENLKYILAVLTGSLTIGSGLTALYSFQAKMDACINAAGNFENLARRARIQIFLPNKLRAHSELVLSEISADLAHLTTTSPLL